MINGDIRIFNGSFSLLKAKNRRSSATVPPSASQRRLIRRRLLSQCSTPPPASTMKKKKPKIPPSKSPPAKTPPKSPTKTPPKSPPCPSSPVKSVPNEKESPVVVTTTVSDAQIGSSTDTVAQQSMEASDLAHVLQVSQLRKTVIDEVSSDPSSDNSTLSSMQLEPSPVSSPKESSAAEKEAIASTTEGLLKEVPTQQANADAKVVPLSSQEAISIHATTSAEKCSVEIAVKPAMDTGKQTKVVLASDKDVNAPTPTTKVQISSDPSDTWCNHAKGLGKRLEKKGEAFTLPSGEACIKIPNSVIEKHRKSWDSFVLGQFYSDPPSQGTLHNIVNGIWSKQYRDIAVSKMEGFAFLFRIPNAATRHRVVTQKLWQIEGQTMFVDKWEPGVVPAKPELTSAPIWLELRNVPFQFFNEDGLERIAGLVGHPKYLHPMTKNKTNLEVAKVFTIIDPRKPLPEAVNVQFDSGEICRVLVSSPWMPPVCDLCKEIGHATKRCPSVVKVCSHCNAKTHVLANCPKLLKKEGTGRKTRRGRSKDKQEWRVVEVAAESDKTLASQPDQTPAPITAKTAFPEKYHKEVTQTEVVHHSKLGTTKDKVVGETSNTPDYLKFVRHRSNSAATRSSQSDVQPDSSDVESSDSELEEGEFSQDELGFEEVRNKKKFSGVKGYRGKGSKNHKF